MDGRRKCDRLRAIRKAICEQNDIPLKEEPCTSSDEGCIGTCPKCDQIMRYINGKLDERRKAGLPVHLDRAAKLYQETKV